MELIKQLRGTPDSIQLATAIVRKADYFLTNDAALKQVKEIKVVVLEDHLPRS